MTENNTIWLAVIEYCIIALILEISLIMSPSGRSFADTVMVRIFKRPEYSIEIWGMILSLWFIGMLLWTPIAIILCIYDFITNKNKEQ
jgi:hypothetical protein